MVISELPPHLRYMLLSLYRVLPSSVWKTHMEEYPGAFGSQRTLKTSNPGFTTSILSFETPAHPQFSLYFL